MKHGKLGGIEPDTITTKYALKNNARKSQPGTSLKRDWHRSQALNPGHYDQETKSHGSTIKPVAMLNEYAPSRIQKVVEEHVDAKRGRPVGHGHANTIGCHQATHKKQGPRENRGEQEKSISQFGNSLCRLQDSDL